MTAALGRLFSTVFAWAAGAALVVAMLVGLAYAYVAWDLRGRMTDDDDDEEGDGPC